jgi:hypothetical protein
MKDFCRDISVDLVGKPGGRLETFDGALKVLWEPKTLGSQSL